MKISFLLILAIIGFSQSYRIEKFFMENQSYTQERLSTKSMRDTNGRVYEVGFSQISSNNQDCRIRKVDSQENELYKTFLDSSPADCRGLALILDSNDRPYAAFSIDGGSYDAGYITKKSVITGAFSGSIFDSLGLGGGPKVSVLAGLRTDNGFIEKATFLRAQLSTGKANSYLVQEISFCADQVSVYSQSWYKSFDKNSSNNKFIGYPEAGLIKVGTEEFFRHYIHLDRNMTIVTQASVKDPLTCSIFFQVEVRQ